MRKNRTDKNKIWCSLILLWNHRSVTVCVCVGVLFLYVPPPLTWPVSLTLQHVSIRFKLVSCGDSLVRTLIWSHDSANIPFRCEVRGERCFLLPVQLFSSYVTFVELWVKCHICGVGSHTHTRGWTDGVSFSHTLSVTEETNDPNPHWRRRSVQYLQGRLGHFRVTC